MKKIVRILVCILLTSSKKYQPKKIVNENWRKKGNFTFAYNIDDFFCDVLFQITNTLSAKQIYNFSVYNRCLLFDQKISKIGEKTPIYCCTFANFQKEIHFFLGWGHFHQIWWGWGQFAQPQKKILENDIGFE